MIDNQRNFHIDGLVQNCNISSVLAMEILQSCTKPSISNFEVSIVPTDGLAPLGVVGLWCHINS